MPATLVIGHFPPPIHGQAVATDAFAVLGRRLGQTVLTVDTSGPSGRPGLKYATGRIQAWTRAVFTLVRERKRFAVAHFGVDANSGLPVTLLLGVLAKWLGYSVRLQHHSFRYMTRTRRVAAAGFAILGRSTNHVVTCQAMADALRRSYGPHLRCSVVSVAYAIHPTPISRQPTTAPLKVGTLGNLGRSKSLDLVLATFTAIATVEGTRLALGGPIVDREGHDWLAEAVARYGDRITPVGQLTGAAKNEFLAGLDVFLFPSRHLDESFGLVVMEALQLGVPVIMVPNLCLGASELGAAGLAISDIDDFPAIAADQIDMWQREPDRYLLAQKAARALAEAHIASAHSAATALWTLDERSSIESAAK